MNFKLIIAVLLVFILQSCEQPLETTPTRRDIVDVVFASGNLEREYQYLVTATTQAYLQESLVEEGDTVQQGALLFRLANDVQQAQLENAQENYRFAQENVNNNAPSIRQLQIQINQVKEKLQRDSTNYARYERLIKTNAVARTDYENAGLAYQNSKTELQVLEKSLQDLKRNLQLQQENARAQLRIQESSNDYYTLRTALTGQVLQIIKTNGELVRPGETIAEIGAGKTIIKLYIPEENINRIKLGQTTLIELNTDKGNIHKGIINKIYPAFNTQEHAFIAEAIFVDALLHLKPGTQLQANIIIAEKSNVMVIPSYFLLPGDSVLVKDRQEKVPVKVGIRSMEWTEILHGIAENTVLQLPKSLQE